MITAPVLVGLVLLGVTAIAIGVWLGRRGPTSSARSFSKSSTTSPAEPEKLPEKRIQSLGLVELAQRLQWPIEDLQNHECSYRTAEIPKPRGGVRRLEIPDDETKSLQRRILNYLLQALNAHPLACGFEPDTSIVHAALPHQGKPLIVKMDVRRFFESTTSERVRTYFEGIGWDTEAAALLTRLTTHNGHLPQGAPTSPRLSNLVNTRMDEALLRLVKRHGGSFSRYADDITMSFPFVRGRTARGLSQAVRRILKQYGYTMHGGSKLKFLRKNQQQRVLGLVVNESVNLPRKTRRWLRAVKHHQATGQPATLSAAQVEGWDALQAMIARQREE